MMASKPGTSAAPPQKPMAPQFSRIRNLSATPLHQACQHSSSAFLFSQTLLSSKAEQGIPLWFESGANAWAIFPFAALFCQPTWRSTTLSRASLSQPGAESAFLSFTHFANRWRFSSASFPFEIFHKIILYMQCLWKDSVACVKNLEFQLLQWHTLHTAFS